MEIPIKEYVGQIPVIPETRRIKPIIDIIIMLDPSVNMTPIIINIMPTRIRKIRSKFPIFRTNNFFIVNYSPFTSIDG